MKVVDLFWRYIFIRSEKYQYKVRKSYEETVTETTEYKVAIGSIPTDSESDSNFVWDINGVTQEKLQELAAVVHQFTEDTYFNFLYKKTLIYLKYLTVMLWKSSLMD